VHESRIAFDDREDESFELSALEGERVLDRSHDVPLRREQSPSRANLQEVETFRLPTGRNLVKVSPLATWTLRDVWQYAREWDIPLMPLYERGYTSIGCEPCTRLPDDPANPRSGRWGGKKLECGIHVQPA